MSSLSSPIVVPLPVVSSLEGEMEELLERHELGLSYRCGDVDALTRIVRDLGRDEARRDRLGANARRLFAERFSAGVIYERYSSFVEELAESRS